VTYLSMGNMENFNGMISLFFNDSTLLIILFCTYIQYHVCLEWDHPLITYLNQSV